jgi:uncharacterized membrane protein
MNIYFLFISAFLVRLINLNQSLWLDEAIVAKVVKSIPFLQIPFQFSIHDFHPPLYYMVMSLWGGVFGSSEIALRMPSIIFSLIAGWYVYKMGGKFAAAFFLFNPLIIYYSQEARMYMMATAFLTASLFHFMNITHSKSRSKKDIVFFNIFSALAMFTFYGSVFFIVGMIIVAFFTLKKKNAFLYLFIGLFVSLLLTSPLLIQQLSNAKGGLAVVKNWSLVLGKAELKNFLMIFLKFATGRLSWYPKWSYYVVAGGSSVLIWILVTVGMIKNKTLSFLFSFPLLIGLIASFITPMMMYFRFLYLIPVMSLLLIEGKLNKLFIKLGVLFIFLSFSLLYILSPQFHREDWKKLVQKINPIKPIYMILPSSDPIAYYNSSITPSELRNMAKIAISGHIQVIPYVEELYGYNHTEVLKKKGCILESRSTYRGPLILENWNCPQSFIGQLSVSSI